MMVVALSQSKCWISGHNQLFLFGMGEWGFHPIYILSMAYREAKCYTSFVIAFTTTKNELIQYIFIKLFQYSQVVYDTDSYKQLLQQQYLTDINVYIFGKRIAIPIHTYHIHNFVTNI